MPGTDSMPGHIPGLLLPSPVSQLHCPLLKRQQVALFIKRDELIHPQIQGNKWRKLKYNLIEARRQGHKHLLSFGGAYSNHLHALAYAGQQLGLSTTGIIRGQRPERLSPTLGDVQRWGMQLSFVSRAEYRRKDKADFIESLKHQFGEFYLIPEGGNNNQGLRGCAELMQELGASYDYLCCEVGSGAMLAGLIDYASQHPAVASNTRLMGFSVMKNPELEPAIAAKLSSRAQQSVNWQINSDYHFGGFARTNPELNRFITEFKSRFAIQLEPVYSAKMLYGIFNLLEQGFFKAGQRILAIHGGGLQGLRGYPELL